MSYLYGLKRANGQAKEGRYHREQLQDNMSPRESRESELAPIRGLPSLELSVQGVEEFGDVDTVGKAWVESVQ